MKLNKSLTLAMALLLGCTMAACGEEEEPGGGEQENLCGNGVLDADEVCDPGSDGSNILWKDGYAHACVDYGTANNDEQDWADGGVPGCAKDCKGLKKGTCVSKEAAVTVNGVKSCIAEIKANDKSVTASVTVVPEDTIANTSVKGKLVCGLDAPIETITSANDFSGSLTAADDSGKLSLSAEVSNAGDNYCVVYIKAGDNNGVACSDGNKDTAKAAGKLSELPSLKVTVEGGGEEPSGELLCSWSKFEPMLNDKGYPDKESPTKLMAGLASEEGSLSSATLKLVALDGVEFQKATLTKAADDTMSMLLIGGNTDGKGWAESKAITADTNSHVLISADISAAAKLSAYASTGDGKMAITTSDGSAETVVLEDKVIAKDSYETISVDIASGTKEIRIYGYEMNGQNIRLDDIKVTK